MPSSNQVAIITGGGRGIGKGIALLFAQNAIDVVVAGRTLEILRQTVAEIEAVGGKGLAVQADVSVISDVDYIFTQTLERFGKVDILVNNAAISQPTSSIIDLELSLLDTIINTNFKGTYYCSRRAAKEMLLRRSGCIINISSTTSLMSTPLIVYGPMKAAVNLFTKNLARELAEHMIRVNSIAPGYVQTQMAEELGDRDISLFLKCIPMHVPLMPHDVAQVALFLASDKARYITGTTIVVDAGGTSEGAWMAYKK